MKSSALTSIIISTFLIIQVPLFIGCVKRVDNPTEYDSYESKHDKYASESVDKINKVFEKSGNDDNEILEARKYVADYNAKLKAAQLYINECMKLAAINPSESVTVLELCKITAYDMNNIYRNGETSQIAPSELEKFREQLSLSQKSLSTEFK